MRGPPSTGSRAMASESSVLHSGSARNEAELTAQGMREGPRYTSYPGVDGFTAFSYGDYLQTLAAVRARGARRMRSLHLHLACCASDCCVCDCSTSAVKLRGEADIAVYLDYLQREIDIQGRLFVGMNGLDGLHLCGAAASCLSDAQIGALLAQARRCFQFAPDELGEYALRIDPLVGPARIDRLRAQGFNQLTLAARLRDPDSAIAPASAVSAARAAGFRVVSVELLIGAPQQTAFSLNSALAGLIDAAPDRILMFHSAHLPGARRECADPAALQARLELLRLCLKRLDAAGYLYLGMDCFVLPADALAVAQRQGRLHLHLQGYSTHADADVIACGLGAVGALGATYSQNQATLDEYYALLDIGELPIARGVRLSMDDALRRMIIGMLMCNFELSIVSLELGYPITFATYFADEIERLGGMEADGLLTIESEWLVITRKGRLLVRDICMVFDRGIAPATRGGSA